MPNVSRIHQRKQPVRRHFIKEWAEARNMTAKEVADALDIDKGQVYRWYRGILPHRETQLRLAALFSIEPEALLRHPDDDWFARFFAGRETEERERIKRAMEIAWPRPKTGTNE